LTMEKRLGALGAEDFGAEKLLKSNGRESAAQSGKGT